MLDMQSFLLISLADQQRQLLRLMERAGRAFVPEAAELSFALESVVTALRDLREGRIEWQEAERLYWVSVRVESACELALLFPAVQP